MRRNGDVGMRLPAARSWEAVHWSLLLGLLLVTLAVGEATPGAGYRAVVETACGLASLHVAALLCGEAARRRRPEAWRRIGPNLHLWRLGAFAMILAPWLRDLAEVSSRLDPATLQANRWWISAPGALLLAFAAWRMFKSGKNPTTPA